MLAAAPDERRAAAEATHQDADAITVGTTQEGHGQADGCPGGQLGSRDGFNA
jgi:hypothetical protein